MSRDDLAGLPDYRVRISPRARRISLRVSASGVEVVLPRGVDQRIAADAVRGRREWIARQLERFANVEPVTLPQEIALPAIGECWPISYSASPAALRLRDTGGALRFTGRCSPEAVATRLREWLIERARPVFAARLTSLQAERGKQRGLGYRRISVRCQRSRWGSYSSRGTLSLNATLLLLAPAQLDYVLLHELAHSRHPNHSADFWALLEQICPGARQLDASINLTARRLPRWVSLR